MTCYRSVSGKSASVAIAGTVFVASLATANARYVPALVVLLVFAGVGLIAAIMLPAAPVEPAVPEPKLAT